MINIQITRIAEEFSSSYARHYPEELKNSKTACLLACAILMLNTDLHNPKVKRKMTKQQFFNIFQNAEDVPSKNYLGALYDSIKREQLKLNSELEYPSFQVPEDLKNIENVKSVLNSSISYRNRFIINGTAHYINIRDLKSITEMNSEIIEELKNSDFYIITFSVTDESSLELSKLIINHIIQSYQYEKKSIRDSIVLVGTKGDDEENRVVSFNKAVQVSLEFGVVYIETSTKTNKNVQEVFNRAFEVLFPPTEVSTPRDHYSSNERKPNILI